MRDYRSMFDLTGRTALVVGAGSGIGRACAEGLAAFGARAICADINEDAIGETASRIVAQGMVAEAVPLNMLKVDSIRAALDRIGAVDVLVSTPSVNVRKPLLQITEEEFDHIVNLNLKGTFLLVRETAAGMADRGNGSIIVFSSIRSQTVEPGQGVYAATKSGVVLMLRALAAELGPRGVRANLVAPGIVDTPLTAQIKNDPDWYQAYADKSILKRWARPDELVGAVIYFASDASSFTTGSVLFVDGGWTAIDGRFSPPMP